MACRAPLVSTRVQGMRLLPSIWKKFIQKTNYQLGQRGPWHSNCPQGLNSVDRVLEVLGRPSREPTSEHCLLWWHFDHRDHGHGCLRQSGQRCLINHRSRQCSVLNPFQNRSDGVELVLLLPIQPGTNRGRNAQRDRRLGLRQGHLVQLLLEPCWDKNSLRASYLS